MINKIQSVGEPAVSQLTIYNLNANETNTVSDDSFSFDGYQVVRSGFFSHTSEPSISFNNCSVRLNTICIRKFPDVNYIQFLINPETQKLAIRACHEDEKDSFSWCNAKRKPRKITCSIFFAKIAALMKWDPQYRYKMFGKTIKTGTDRLILFDLNSAEAYRRIIKEIEKAKPPYFPVFAENKDVENHFGPPAEKHQKFMQINAFDGYSVLGIKTEKNI